MTELWRSAPAQDLLWVDLGDHYALHHRPSGKTHFLNKVAADLLRQGLDRPSSLDDVQFALGWPQESATALGPGESTLGLLRRFEELGLVDREGP